MRLIDADALYNRFLQRAWYDNADRDECACVDVYHATTVDAVVVTRCKDCVHWDDDSDTYGADYGPKGKYMKSFETVCADDFCSYGEKDDKAVDDT